MMAHLVRLVAVAIVLLASSEAVAQRLYVTSFQSGKLDAIDLGAGKRIYSIAVQDGSGVIGLAVTPDGETLLVVDGGSASRLRMFAANSGREISTRSFRNRAAQLGGSRVVSMSSDGRWLFVKIRGEHGPMGGVLVFDVERRHFLQLGKQIPECPWPEFAGSPGGRFIAVCPGAAMELASLGPGRADFTPIRRVALPEPDVAGVASTPNGDSVYILPYAKPSSPWRLLEWPAGNGNIVGHDLPESFWRRTPAERQAWLCMSADGEMLGVVAGRGALVLNRRTLAPLRDTQLPGAAQEATFTPDGRLLLTMDTSAARLWLVSIPSPEVAEKILPTKRFGVGPIVMLVSAPPSRIRH